MKGVNEDDCSLGLMEYGLFETFKKISASAIGMYPKGMHPIEGHN